MMGESPSVRLVHQHELGARHEPRCDGQHLLLAAGKALALLGQTLAQAREVAQHLLRHRIAVVSGAARPAGSAGGSPPR